VFISPRYATDQSIYLTYAEPGDYGGGLALARARLNVTPTTARLANLEVLWRQMPKGKGGQEGAQIAFAPSKIPRRELRLWTCPASAKPALHNAV
jgi:glucose/arabinose dehydrogenase